MNDFRCIGVWRRLLIGGLAWLLPTPSTFSAMPELFWSQAGGVYHSDVDLLNPEIVVAGYQIEGIAVAQHLDRLVWSDIPPTVPIFPSGTVSVSRLDGSADLVAANQLAHPAGLEIDHFGQYMYWTDWERGEVWRGSVIEPMTAEAVVAQRADLSEMTDVALEPTSGKIYFSYTNPLIDGLFSGAIGRANLDGTAVELVVGGLVSPQGIALSTARNELFWTDLAFGGGVIGRARLDGSGVQEIVKDLKTPRGLAWDPERERIYWADTDAGKIQRATADGQDITDILVGLDHPWALAVASAMGATCDLNGDGLCDVNDIDRMYGVGDLIAGVSVPPAPLVFDRNADAVVNRTDVDQWLAEAAAHHGLASAYVRGDANLDGKVNATDLNALGRNWRQSESVWSGGDFTGEGFVDAADLNALATHWQSQWAAAGAPAAVPEPSAWLLLVNALLAGIRWFSRITRKAA